MLSYRHDMQSIPAFYSLEIECNVTPVGAPPGHGRVASSYIAAFSFELWRSTFVQQHAVTETVQPQSSPPLESTFNVFKQHRTFCQKNGRRVLFV
ncbi:hypothetical protein LSAT2_027550, partial [Lamellibrachia satsuma]